MAQSTAGAVLGSETTIAVAVEGTTTVNYFAIDNAGNAEPQRSLLLKIDKTPPLISGLPRGCVLWPSMSDCSGLLRIAGEP